MKTLSEKNYEIWFMDYLDGKLTGESVNQLLAFLELHPELREELQEIEGFALNADDHKYPWKSDLRKSEDDMEGIGREDQWCIARMENDLSPAEAEAFDRRLEREPALKQAYGVFQTTRLVPETLTYPGKATLRHKTRTLYPWIITALSSAAILVLALVLWPRAPEEVGEMAEKPVVPALQAPETSTVAPPSVFTPPVQQLSANTRTKVSLPKEDQPVTNKTEPREFIPMEALAPSEFGFLISIPDPAKSPVIFASLFPVSEEPAYLDDYLSLPQLALKLFRERVLGQDPEIVKQTRFSMWEVAGAGVDRLNQVAGTDMTLEREYNPDGQLMAISFNSRLFDLETPVRTNGNGQ